MTMNSNMLYALIGVLILCVGALGYSLHQEQQKKSGIEISIGQRGISVDTK
jgi:hypothetical protein